MYNILIVDDEILAIEFLKQLVDWAAFDCQVAGTATTVQKALELAKRIKPDIIFMDIKMPGMDGIELSQKILCEIPDAEIVVLTAHQDFEFAKKALQIGVRDFLIKHELTAEILSETIEKAISQVESKKKVSNIIVEEWMRKGWLGETADVVPETVNRYAGSYRLLLLRTPTILSGPGKKEDAQWEKCKTEPAILGKLYEKSEYAVFLIGAEGIKSENLRREFFVETGFRLIETYRKLDKTIFGLYSKEFDKWEQLSEACQELKKMLETDFFRMHCLMFPEEYGALPYLTPEWPISFEREFVNCLISESQSMKSFWDQVFGTTYKNFLVQKEDLEPLRKFILKYSENLCCLGGVTSISDVEKIREEFKTCALEQKREMSQEDVKVQKALEYVEKHFGEEINAAVISEKIHISEGHLRKLFKQKSGITLKEHILKYRIEQAKKYLEKSTYRITEIADLCGFKTSQHFSTVFKMMVGKTPREYVESINENDK